MSNVDKFNIFSQSTNPTVIQSHLKKLFAGIHQVKFVDDGNLKTIVAVKSLEGETVQLNNPVIVTNNVEVNFVSYFVLCRIH